MKKIIQISLIILILIFVTVGYTNGYGVGKKSVPAYTENKMEIDLDKQPKPLPDAAQVSTAISKEAEIKKVLAERRNGTEEQKYAVDPDKIIESNRQSEISVNGRIDPDKPMVALTFDDGPHPKYSIEIAEALKKNDALATFFVLGSRAEKYKSTVNKIAENGNEIGNHTYSHRELTRLKNVEIQSEIRKTSDILKAITGKTPFLTRPSYGSVNDNVKTYAGSPLILWSVDTQDWKSRDKDKIVHRTMSTVKDGDIILMHDIYKSSADAAKVVISELKAKGYQMVTISQLYQARGISLKNGKEYFECSTYYAGKNKK